MVSGDFDNTIGEFLECLYVNIQVTDQSEITNLIGHSLDGIEGSVMRDFVAARDTTHEQLGSDSDDGEQIIAENMAENMPGGIADGFEQALEADELNNVFDTNLRL
jgi:hypothetical protein